VAARVFDFGGGQTNVNKDTSFGGVAHPHPHPVSILGAGMATSVHSDGEEDQLEESEPGEDGYWPALEILNERKHDYLVHWDGVNPETGRAWTPSWTAKTEVTEDLIEAWQAKKAAKKKRNRRGALGPLRRGMGIDWSTSP
jgi:hypothetical protein